MKLLVSVASPDEAVEALSGGADIIDAKDPFAGSLGAVSIDVLRAISTSVGGVCPVSAALGDASNEAPLAAAASAFSAAGAQLVKIGFAGITDAERAMSLARAAVGGTGSDCAVVVVAYADADRSMTLAPADLLDVAARGGAKGVLLDTFDKHGPGLRGLISAEDLAAWIGSVHRRELFAAVAGKLTAGDLAAMREVGADIAGVRSAACVNGRTGCISRESVRTLRAECRRRPTLAAAQLNHAS